MEVLSESQNGRQRLSHLQTENFKRHVRRLAFGYVEELVLVKKYWVLLFWVFSCVSVVMVTFLSNVVATDTDCWRVVLGKGAS